MISIGIVDDMQSSIDSIKSYCEQYAKEKNEQFSISVFHDGMDIMKLSSYPEILFLDINMPLLNGLKAAKKSAKRTSPAS